MKTPFVHVSLVIAAGVALALAAKFAGLIPASWFSLQMMIATYAAGGVLAFAIRDYSRSTSYDVPRARRAARRPGKGVKPVGLEPTFGWTHQTIAS